MKKFIKFLQTTLTQEVRTTVGYTIFQFLIILTLMISGLSICSDYFDYKKDMELIHKQDSIRICLYEKYIFDEETLNNN